jgi:hypothetical protein
MTFTVVLAVVTARPSVSVPVQFVTPLAKVGSGAHCAFAPAAAAIMIVTALVPSSSALRARMSEKFFVMDPPTARSPTSSRELIAKPEIDCPVARIESLGRQRCGRIAAKMSPDTLALPEVLALPPELAVYDFISKPTK